MLDNMVVPLPNGDIDVSMLKEAVELINGRFETEVTSFLLSYCFLFVVLMISIPYKNYPSTTYTFWKE